ncbi:MAG TPA: MerC domain-containing protein [Candidatus Melainabacteria bacterium]|nr:MerC domain-containing protein [Candidatus Melainabacteria bacterium]HMP54702.1 MerC domain-containing protein [Candidatus Melainabacteria bacterium]
MKSDLLGMTTSGLCAIHCLATPLLVGLLPASRSFLEGRGLHIVIASAVFVFGSLAIYAGFKRHRNPKVLLSLSTGLILVISATLSPSSSLRELLELPVLLTGGFLMIYGHYMNHILCTGCDEN